MKTAPTRIAAVLRHLPVPQPRETPRHLHVTVRESVLPEPRRLHVGEYIERGPRSGLCGRIGGRPHCIRYATGRVEWIHTGDYELATAAPLLAAIARRARLRQSAFTVRGDSPAAAIGKLNSQQLSSHPGRKTKRK